MNIGKNEVAELIAGEFPTGAIVTPELAMMNVAQWKKEALALRKLLGVPLIKLNMLASVLNVAVRLGERSEKKVGIDESLDGDALTVLRLLAAEVAKLGQISNWIPVEDALPYSGEAVMVKGPNDYVSHRQFYTLAVYDAAYRPKNPWQTIQNDGLSDCGWVPTHWRKLAEDELS